MAKNIDLSSVGERIKKSRNASGMSQEELAEIVNVGVTHISNIENKKREPSLKVFVKIAEALNVTPNDLLCGSLEVLKPALLKETEEIFEGCSPREIEGYKKIIKVLKETK